MASQYPFPHRTCYEKTLFRSLKHEIDPDPTHWEQLEAGYVWGIASREPEGFPLVEDTPGWRRVRLRPSPHLPSLFVYYTIEESGQVAFEAVERADRPPPVPTFFDTWPTGDGRGGLS